MTHQPPRLDGASPADAGRQVAQLRQVLLLVQQIADRGDGSVPLDPALDEAARIVGAYGEAWPIVQRRFDALVAETVAWAAAGVEALTVSGGSQAAAARLADELERAIGDLLRLLKL